MDKSYIDSYKNLINTNDATLASGWGNRSTIEMFQLLNHLQTHLDLNQTSILYDIGCGSGLMSIGLSSQVKRVLAFDFIPEMVEFAIKNTSNIPNVKIDSLDISQEPNLIHHNKADRILLNSVLQALPSDELMLKAIDNLDSILKSAGKIFIGSNANRLYKNEYIKGYHDLELPSEIIEQKVQEQERAIWVDIPMIQSYAQEKGYKVTQINAPKCFWSSWYMTDLLLEK